MLAPIFAFFYLLLNAVIGIDLYLWIKSFRNPFRWRRAKLIFVSGYVILTSIIFVAYFLPSGRLKTIFSRISNYYQGFLINVIMIIIAAHILAFILKILKRIPSNYFKSGKTKFMAGWICAVLSISFSMYGFINANHIEVTSYDVTVDKPGDDMKIVLVSDIHLGYSYGVKNIKRMVRKINELQPDLVCLAGDIFDNDFYAMDDPKGIEQQLSAIESTYGVYACWGNHDIDDRLFGGFTVSTGEVKSRSTEMTEMLERAGIRILEDEAVTVADKFTIIGRLDYSKPTTADGTRKAITDFEFDRSKLVIDIDHEPYELQETADAGIDLDLCGHTHNGQFFPLNLTIGYMWENPAGYIKKISTDGSHTMHNIVSEGVGVYGPFMRTFTKSEIVEINVHMK